MTDRMSRSRLVLRDPQLRGSRPALRVSLLAGLLLGAWALIPQVALAKDCGGGVPCECGDRVVASTTLATDITNCASLGLEVRAGILDCDGHLIAGPGDRVAGEGIWINRASGVAVRNCVVRNFDKGVLVDSTTDSVIDHVEVFNNTVGVWVGEGSMRNELRAIKAHDNRDEGVHLGGGSSDNLLIDSELIANRNENLYLIETARNRIINNLLDRSTEASLLLKHAKDNFFSKNLLAKRNVMVRGDSSGNVFQNTQLYNGRFTFQSLEEDDRGWTHPHGNTVRGGRVLKAGTCFMLIGAYQNTVTDVLADNCRAKQEKKAGGLVPYENVVELNFIGGGPGGGGSGGGGSGGGSTSDKDKPKGTIKFDDPGNGNDTLKIKGVLSSATPLDALHEDVTIRLEDAGGVTYAVFVPAGVLRESGRSAEYEHGEDGLLPGVDAIEIRRESIKTWSFRLAAKDDLSSANEAQMTLTVQVGAAVFSFPDAWSQTSEGWRLR